jgi:hypothetical protein
VEPRQDRFRLKTKRVPNSARHGIVPADINWTELIISILNHDSRDNDFARSDWGYQVYLIGFAVAASSLMNDASPFNHANAESLHTLSHYARLRESIDVKLLYDRFYLIKYI